MANYIGTSLASGHDIFSKTSMRYIIYAHYKAYKALFRFQNTKCKIFVNRLHDVLNVVKKNCITQMDRKAQDESNELNCGVIKY